MPGHCRQVGSHISLVTALHRTGMADALEKGYLHKCLFGFAADVDAQQLLEQVTLCSSALG